MKKFLLFLVAVILCACSNDKVAGISTVETENAYLIQVVHEDSLPAAGVLARMRAASFVRSIDGDSAAPEYYEEFVTDSLGCIRIDSLGVDVATIEIVDKGKGLFRKIFAEDMRKFEGQRFVLAKTVTERHKLC